MASAYTYKPMLDPITRQVCGVVRSDGAHIPRDPSLPDYQAFLAAQASAPTLLLGAGLALADYQALKCAAIDARTQQIVAGGFAFGGAQFNLATTDQLNLTALFSFSANLTFPVGFTTTNNGAFSIPDAATLRQMAGTALSAIRSAVDAGRALKVQVLAATSTAAVDAVVDSR